MAGTALVKSPGRFKRALIELGVINRPLTKRVYEAAQVSRFTEDWFASIMSPRQEIQFDLIKIRARARALVRDNALARRFIGMCQANVVGPKGIRLRARTPTIDGGELRSPENAAIEDAWRVWGTMENASLSKGQSWLDHQSGAVAAMHTDGEALFRLIKGAKNAFGFTLQQIDADLLNQEVNLQGAPGKNSITMGVETNPNGEVVAYHCWKRHPTDSMPDQGIIVIPADEMIHLKNPLGLRIGQVRGVSSFAAVMMPLRMLGAYIENELIASRASSAKLGFFLPTAETAMTSQETATTIHPSMDMTPGSWSELPPGMTVDHYDPQHPMQQFGDFIRATLRIVSTGLNVSFSSLTGDLSAANYSSSRAGLIEEREQWRLQHSYLIEHFLRPVYKAWLPMAALSGQLKIPPQDLIALAEPTFIPRGWQWTDPLKDRQAAVMGIQNGLSSRTIEAAEEGHDIEDIFRDLADEDQLAAKHGITLNTAPPMPPHPMGGGPANAEPSTTGDSGNTGSPGDADSGQ
jgi:lambda family phage portal protein